MKPQRLSDFQKFIDFQNRLWPATFDFPTFDYGEHLWLKNAEKFPIFAEK